MSEIAERGHALGGKVHGSVVGRGESEVRAAEAFVEPACAQARIGHTAGHIEYCAQLPVLEGPPHPAGCIAEQRLIGADRQYERAMTAEIELAMLELEPIILAPPIHGVEADTTGSLINGDRSAEHAAPGEGALIAHSQRRPHRELGLERVVVGAV